MDFHLDSHEVMRGIRVVHDSLVLRPLGLVTIDSGIDSLAGTGVVALAWFVGGWWWVSAPYGLFLLIDGALRVRVSVVATEDTLTVRNRWRKRSFPLSDVAAASVDMVEWVFRSPAYAFTRWPGPRKWQVGTLVTKEGEHIRCDALISWPPRQGDDPSPTEMKVGTLNRWMDAVASAN